MMKQSEAILQRGSYERVLWKYVANLQENTHIEVQFQLLKSHFSIGVLLQIYSAFSKNLLIRTSIGGTVSE